MYLQAYPYVAIGFSDTSAFLRKLTLKSMLTLAPKLSQRTISGSLLKYLSKLQVSQFCKSCRLMKSQQSEKIQPILLGNIASHLNEGTRKRVLINAFTVRALCDTFSPARGAGIMALCATSAYYDVTEIATRILPNVIVLTIDPGRFFSASRLDIPSAWQLPQLEFQPLCNNEASETTRRGKQGEKQWLKFDQNEQQQHEEEEEEEEVRSLEAFANAKTKGDFYNPSLIKKQKEFYKNAKHVKKYKKLLKQQSQQHDISSAIRSVEKKCLVVF
nr:n-terminal kinase-like protein [Quercus suber]